MAYLGFEGRQGKKEDGGEEEEGGVRLGGFLGFGEEHVFGVVRWVFAAYTLAPFYLAGWGGDSSLNGQPPGLVRARVQGRRRRGIRAREDAVVGRVRALAVGGETALVSGSVCGRDSLCDMVSWDI